MTPRSPPVSDLGWFSAFALILLLMGAVSGWMAWYSRRAMRSHKDQIEDMIREMKGVIDEGRDDVATSSSADDDRESGRE